MMMIPIQTRLLLTDPKNINFYGLPVPQAAVDKEGDCIEGYEGKAGDSHPWSLIQLGRLHIERSCYMFYLTPHNSLQLLLMRLSERLNYEVHEVKIFFNKFAS